MKIIPLFISFFILHTSFAQNVSLKHDTIFTDKTAYALIKKEQTYPVRYNICALNGNELIEIHDARIDIKGKPAYVVTFLNDRKQGMVVKDANFPRSFISEVVKYGLVNKGVSVNTIAELEFIKAHPLPDGYTDVEQLFDKSPNRLRHK